MREAKSTRDISSASWSTTLAAAAAAGATGLVGERLAGGAWPARQAPAGGAGLWPIS